MTGMVQRPGLCEQKKPDRSVSSDLLVKVFFIAAYFLVLRSCHPSENIFPYASYDFSTDQLILGLSFPPIIGLEQYQYTFESMEDLSMDRLRFDIHWDYIEAGQGSRDWSSLADRLSLLTNEGYKVFTTIDLKSFPAWFFTLNDTAQQDALRSFVQELLANFKDQISFLQFGNEWNWEVETHFNNDLAQFVALALSQGRMKNVYFDETPLFSQEEIDDFDKAACLNQVDQLSTSVRFEALDLHFYADFWDWDIYLDALEQALQDAGHTESYPVIASEFGGAHPELESLDEAFQADRFVSYVHTLDNIGVREAYFFKLVENPEHSTEFWNSFLVDSKLHKTAGYEVIRRFGVEAAERSRSK